MYVALVNARTYTRGHTRTHTLEKLDTEAEEQITAGLQQRAILNRQKTESRKQKKSASEIPIAVLDLGGLKKWHSGRSASELAEHHLTFSLTQTANSAGSC